MALEFIILLAQVQLPLIKKRIKMAHFAKLNDNNIVEQVIVVHNDDAPNEIIGLSFIASIGLEGNWKQTSFNTYAGKHLLGGTPLRKNFAGIGFTYDEAKNAFIPPKPHETSVLDEETCCWLTEDLEIK
jgi:hypothetical protein